MELLRSLIFVPGNRPKMLEKARTFNADVIVIDLEDSVPPREKANARELAREWVPELGALGKRVMVRVNSLETGLSQEELAAVVGAELYGISVGKVTSAWDIQEVDRLIAVLETAAQLPPGGIRLIPWIENARAVIMSHSISRASARVAAIAFGAEDYTNDMEVEHTDFGEEVVVPRAMTAMAARAAGVGALNTPFVKFREPEGLRHDARRGRQLGYTGKFAIHSAQIDLINEIFSPSEAEISYAEQVVDAWKQAEAAGRGSADLDGRMIDVPVLNRAQNLLALAEAIHQRERI